MCVWWFSFCFTAQRRVLQFQSFDSLSCSAPGSKTLSATGYAERVSHLLPNPPSALTFLSMLWLVSGKIRVLFSNPQNILLTHCIITHDHGFIRSKSENETFELKSNSNIWNGNKCLTTLGGLHESDWLGPHGKGHESFRDSTDHECAGRCWWCTWSKHSPKTSPHAGAWNWVCRLRRTSCAAKSGAARDCSTLPPTAPWRPRRWVKLEFLVLFSRMSQCIKQSRS